MKIRIGDYFISSDNVSVTLYHIRIRGEDSKDKGSEYKELVGYFTGIIGALNKLIEHSMLVSDARDIKTLMDIVADTKALIKESMKSGLTQSEREEVLTHD